MLDIFLPSWCIVVLKLVALIATLSLDWDRQAQVSIKKMKLTL